MSRVIRGGGGGDGPARGPRVVPGEVFDARAEAERIVNEAKQRAEELMDATREQAREIREQARREGEASGRAEVLEQLVQATRARERALCEAEREAVTLSIGIARRIVGEALDAKPAHVRDMVRRVLDRVRTRTSIRVRVHPDDAGEVQEMARDAGIAGLAMEQDADMERGGCVVTTDVGELDARIEVQLDTLARALVGTR